MKCEAYRLNYVHYPNTLYRLMKIPLCKTWMYPFTGLEHMEWTTGMNTGMTIIIMQLMCVSPPFNLMSRINHNN